MKKCTTSTEMALFLEPFRKEGRKIGFVPTMGALHKGHISLIKECRQNCDVTVSSIFVNPLQFNDKNDFVNYPKTIDEDINLLTKNGCDAVLIPEVKEIYPDDKKKHYELGYLEEIMEGAHRPDHFQGVAAVVDRLFNIINPHKAFFGAKDFQQVMVIKKMTELTGSSVEIITCPTIRESDGLAMSSRNMRLNANERQSAAFINIALSQIPEKIRNNKFSDVSDWYVNYINNVPFLKSEYLEIASPETLEIVHEPQIGKVYVAFTAVYCGNVRLIDNIFFAL